MCTACAPHAHAHAHVHAHVDMHNMCMTCACAPTACAPTAYAQLRLQLEARGFSYRELPWRLTQQRIYHHAAPNETAAARAARLERAKPTGAEGGAWRAAHGLAAKHSDQCSVSGSATEPPVASKRWRRW